MSTSGGRMQRCSPTTMALLAALLLLLAVGGATAATIKVESRTVVIYSNGSLGTTWHDNSVGCLRCNISDVAKRRNGSASSLSAIVAPWGGVSFTSVAAYSSQSVLDFWAKGSGLNAISVYVKDSATKTLSRDVRFGRVDQMSDAVTVLGSDDDGFIHIQIDLAALQTPTNASASASCSTGVASRFDRIMFDDISGMGFNLLLDDVTLTTPDLFAASSWVLPTTLKAPVFNEDLPSLRSGKNRYLMKLKKETSFADVNAICQELAGTTPLARRFSGLCNTPMSALQAGSTSGSSALSWHLATLTVKSAADLEAMRSSLADKVEYFEADLTAFTTIPRALRALRQAASTSDGGGAAPGDKLSTYVQEGCDSDLPWVSGSSCGGTGLKSSRAVPDSSGEIKVSGMTLVPAANITTNATVANTTSLSNATAGSNTTVANITTNNGSSPAPLAGSVTSANTPAGSTDTIAPSPAVDGKDPVAVFDDSVDVAEGTIGSLASVSSWGLDRINQESLPLDGVGGGGDYDGRGVHVYVLDSGVRATHVDFRGRIGDGASAVGSSVNDDDGHGTHVCGTAIGSVHGVARSATLHPVKVTGADGSASYSNIIAGIQWVKDHKARNSISSAIISMSIAGPRSAALNDAVESAVAAGITVIAAAGNNKGGDACTMSPCSAQSAIAVGSSTDTDAMSSFSNIGTCLSLFAPGSSITSAGMASDNAEVIMSGTSMATPHVAGVAALYLQYRPGASPAEVKAALKGAAVSKFFESSSPQKLLNMMSARLRAAGPKTTPIPTPALPPVAKPSPSPKPAAATPKPAPAPAPAPSTTFPSMFPSMSPSFCSSCPWCMFC